MGDGTTAPSQHGTFDEPDCDWCVDGEGRTMPLSVLRDARELNRNTSRSLYGMWGVMENIQKNNTLNHAETQASLELNQASFTLFKDELFQRMDRLEEWAFSGHRRRWYQQGHAESLPLAVDQDDAETPEAPSRKHYRVEHLRKLEGMLCHWHSM